MQVLKEFYKKKNRLNIKYDFDDYSFYMALKGKIFYFRSQYHYIEEIISKINMDIKINHLKRENEEWKFLVKVYNTDLNLLKEVSMNLLYKHDFQFRRKIGNLMADLILSNYSNLLDTIEETNYILTESLILLKKKLVQLKELNGPDNIKTQYEKKLKDHYLNILQKLTSKFSTESENIEKKIPDMNLIKEDDSKIQFHQLNNENQGINEAVILNLFFRIKSSFDNIFNHSIHNNTEQINSQIKEELEKFKNTDKSSMNESNEKKMKESNSIKININYIDKEESQMCESYFQGINKFRKNLIIKDDITLSQNKSILNLFEPLKGDKYIEANISQFRTELEKLSKYYNLEDSANIKNVSNLYFNGEILDLLMEKKTYQNYESLQNEEKLPEIEEEEKNVLDNFTRVEPMLQRYLEIIESMKNIALIYIKQFENIINFEERPEIDDPFLFLRQYEDVPLLNIISPDEIKETYFLYLIYFYFCARDVSKYLKDIKGKYNDVKLIIEFKNIFEKLKQLDIFNSTIKYKEINNLKEEWNTLKSEENFIKGNNDLNQKIKEYVIKNDENQFLNDLNNITKLKSAKINLSLPDPQNIIIKAYWIQNKIPWTIPKELKFVKKEY